MGVIVSPERSPGPMPEASGKTADAGIDGVIEPDPPRLGSIRARDRAFGDESFDLRVGEAVGEEDLAGVLAVDGSP